MKLSNKITLGTITEKAHLMIEETTYMHDQFDMNDHIIS